MTKYTKHIIIVGSARSGTSWLAETIARQHRYRLLFEPDHEFQTKKGVLLCDQWIDNFTDTPDALHYLKKVFANRVNSDWIAQNSNRKWKRHLWPGIPVKFVIKFVRTNLMAATINKKFGIPVVHIIRNPYDTIASQHRVKFPWLYDLSHFQKQPKLVSLVKDHFHIDLEGIDSYSDVQKLALRWCLENVIPLAIQKVKSDNYKVLRYEDLRSNSTYFLDLCHEFKLTPVVDIEQQYSKPSSKTHPNSTVLGGDATLWNASDRKAVETILELFGLKHYDDLNWANHG